MVRQRADSPCPDCQRLAEARKHIGEIHGIYEIDNVFVDDSGKSRQLWADIHCTKCGTKRREKLATALTEKAANCSRHRNPVRKTGFFRRGGDHINFYYGKWKPAISIHGKQYALGSYDTEEEALAVRKEAVIAAEGGTFDNWYSEFRKKIRPYTKR